MGTPTQTKLPNIEEVRARKTTADAKVADLTTKAAAAPNDQKKALEDELVKAKAEAEVATAALGALEGVLKPNQAPAPKETSDPLTAVMGQKIVKNADVAEDAANTVLMEFPTRVTLNVSYSQQIVFEPGVQRVDAEIAKHPYLAAHGAKIHEDRKAEVKPAQPGKAPATAPTDSK